jgi:hypothetical protein
MVTEQAKVAAERPEESFGPSVVAQVFAYHTVEAYLNYVGERIAPEIWKDERNYFRNEPWRGAEGKLKRVLSLVGILWEPESRHLKSILELKEIRDLIAHGKAQKLQAAIVHSIETEPLQPTSRLRGFVTDKIKLALLIADVVEFLDDIQKHAKPMLKVDDVWFGDEALKGPPWHMSGVTRLT